MCDWSPYPDNERDKQIDKESNKIVTWCLAILIGLFCVVAFIAEIL